jgi:hypothetical protein
MAPKGPGKVPAQILPVDTLEKFEVVPVKSRYPFELRPAGPDHLPLRKLPKKGKPFFEAAHQERVLHHRHQRGGERHGDPERDVIPAQPVEHRKKGKIGLDQAFEEPVFLKEDFVLRMANIGKVRVQDKDKIPTVIGHDVPPSFSA